MGDRKIGVRAPVSISSSFPRSRAHGFRIISLLTLLLTLLSACSSLTLTPEGPPTPNLALTQAFAQALEQATRAVPTETPIPPTATGTGTPTVTPTPLRTPSPLPPIFTSAILDKTVLPQTYIEDTCQYLKARWDPNNSIPGTVVMVVMYHSVTEDYNTLFPDGSQVHHSDVVMTLEHAHEVGFETITADQLADFLETNARIPARSLLLIVDDRKRQEFYETHFIPHLSQYGWKITNAWIAAKDTPQYLYEENQAVVRDGWIDVQSHGVVHNIPMGDATDDAFMRGELFGAAETIEDRFGKRPVGFIWPGGGFNRRSVELAREAGYRVGFTTNPRGPVMFNWIPQSDKADANHPSWLPELPAGDPLMTLPRYWSSDAAYRIDDVIAIGDEAKAEAEKNRENELIYYDVMCKSRTGELPTATP